MISSYACTLRAQLLTAVALRRKALGPQFSPGAPFLEEDDLELPVLLYRRNGLPVGTVRLRADEKTKTCALEMLAIPGGSYKILIEVIKDAVAFSHAMGCTSFYATVNCSSVKMWEKLGAKYSGEKIFIGKYGVWACPMAATVKQVEDYLEGKKV